MQPRFLYLHGFASGPHSAKAIAFAEHFAQQGVGLDRLDLQVPSLEHLRLSAMIAEVQSEELLRKIGELTMERDFLSRGLRRSR